MSHFNSIRVSDSTITKNAAGVLRTSQLTTLFDGKLQNRSALDSENWDLKQSGATITYQGNKVKMELNANNEYAIYQSNKFFPYFSGKTQVIELTFIDFHSQLGKVKDVGYFSSNAVAPFASNLDGFWLRSTATGYSIEVYNDGTQVQSIAYEDWDNYELINANIDWSGFNVGFFEYLWLGGAVLKLWLDLPGRGFTLAHTYVHAGHGQDDLICKSPHQPVRYSIRSTTADVGSFTAVCSQVATEGATETEGRGRVHYNVTSIPVNTVGVTYPILGLKKAVANRNISTVITSVSANVLTGAGGALDTGILLLLKNPTIVTPGASTFTYVNASSGVCQIATAVVDGGNVPTVSVVGTVLGAIPVSSGGASDPNFNQNTLLNLTQSIDDVFDSYVLAYLATTSTQSINAVMAYKEF